MAGFAFCALILLACSSFYICLTASSSLQLEIEALQSVKHSATSGHDHGYFTNWVQNPTSGDDVDAASPCDWSGVTCSPDRSTVVALNISGLNLSGTLSPAVGNLSNLASLSVACSQLSGELPVQLSHLSALRYLNISNNAFFGMFPRNFSRLSSLEVLDASGNNFTGELPAEVGVLFKLKHLHLGANFFTGRIPPSFGNLESVEYLNVGYNNLIARIPVQLCLLKKLRYLYLSYNSLEGSIPLAIGLLTNLVIMDFQSCKLQGAIPSTLSSLSKLNTLFLQKNRLNGTVPTQLGNLTALKSLDLSSNLLSGVLPSSLCDLTNLELLSLLYNFLHGPIPACIGDLPKLQVLKLFNNYFTGEIPQRLGLISSQLRQVDLCCNSLTGPIPPHICAGGQLEWLLLLSNRLSEQIPANLAMCTTLTRVRLGDNKLTGTIPAGLLMLPNLDILELNSNNLQGLALPIEIASPCKLKALNLANNRLTGPLVPSIANMSGLEELNLSNNSIVGSIPLEIGLLSNHLSSLDLSTNLLTGSIPANIVLCDRLSQLNLSRNCLSGTIPCSLQNMTSLASLDLSFNNLSGIAPEGGAFNASSLQGNPHLLYSERASAVALTSCTGVQAGEADTSSMHKSMSKSMIAVATCMIVAAGLGALGLLIIMCGWFLDDLYIFNQSYKGISLWVHKLHMRKPASTRAWRFEKFERLDFTIQDVLRVLEDRNIIGQGGSGTVYKGEMPGGRVLAIKCLHAFSAIAEIETLGNLSHRHIVKLLGWCSNRNTSLLLYDYMPSGSLGQLLHKEHATTCTLPCAVRDSWETRFKIALGAAEGLAYLHHDCSPPILHRDVKPNNILIDNRYEAKLADFGFARAMEQGNLTQSISVIAGTCGYMAPEHAHTSRVSEKSDVYSYGVVLLELVTGRKPTGVEYGDGMDMVKWARVMALTDEGMLQMLDASIIASHQVASCEAVGGDQEAKKAQNIGGQAQLHLASSSFSSSATLASSFSSAKLSASPSTSSSSSCFSSAWSTARVEVRMSWVLQVGLKCVAEDPHKRPSMREVLKMLKR